ncbi:hypothetical protein EXIGLDRAFT_776176 [Exidia glandulosa HHB12029]|uniref:Zn(2)-C6 fungal-type domain-containing protein n=1 Tax=Exidia glandulosa HHB12029 TaxID=1314781 RepID=A0A165ZPZ9_EXIGL|nr:hypothetical protein EXIGLDRAFT_776176 [Exidia glandulosa HHB12029]
MSLQVAATYWACEPCHLSHAKCDRSATGEVPCPRCVRRGRADKCRLRPIRSRGPKAQMDATQPVAAQTQADALHQADATADVTPQQDQDSTLGGLFLGSFTSQVDVVNSNDVAVPTAVPSHLLSFGVSHPPIDDTYPSTSSGEIPYGRPPTTLSTCEHRPLLQIVSVAVTGDVHLAEPSAQTWADHDIGRFDMTFSASFAFDDFSSSTAAPHAAVHVNDYPFALDANVFDAFSTYNPAVWPVRTATAGVTPARVDLDGCTVPADVLHEVPFNSWSSSPSTRSSTADMNYGIYSQANQATVCLETFLAEFEERGSILDNPSFSEAGSFNFTWNTEEPGRRNQQVDGLGSFEWNNAASASTDTPQNLDFMRHCGH